MSNCFLGLVNVGRNWLAFMQIPNLIEINVWSAIVEFYISHTSLT